MGKPELRATSIHINILHADESPLAGEVLPGSTDWNAARRVAIRAVEEAFEKLGYFSRFQVTTDRDEVAGAEVFCAVKK